MTTIVSIAPKFKHGEVIVEQQNFTLGKVTRMQLQNDHDIGVYMFSKFKQSLKREREKKNELSDVLQSWSWKNQMITSNYCFYLNIK